MSRQIAEYIKEHLKIQIDCEYDHYSGKTVYAKLLMKTFDGDYEIISEDQFFLVDD